jgi:hypothetical protein
MITVAWLTFVNWGDLIQIEWILFVMLTKVARGRIAGTSIVGSTGFKKTLQMQLY